MSKPRIAFAVIFLVFVILGGLMYLTATSWISGLLYWTAFGVLGITVAQKGYACFAPDEV